MADEFFEEGAARRRIPPVRIAIAAVLVVALLVFSLMYHDGVIAVDDVEDVTEHGALYRVKGVAVDVDENGFVLQADGASLPVMWNLTTPSEGATYVVNGAYNGTAEALRAEAVVRAYVF